MLQAAQQAVASPWATLGQRWGHPWHSMCSYLGTFPGALSRSMIAMLSDAGDVVLDPFSGRGTTLLEARLMSRFPLAVDLNPIAVALSRAKNTSVSQPAVKERIEALRENYDRLLYLPEAQVQKDDIQLIFHPATLAQLCYLRRSLVRSQQPVDQFLVGALLGVMHGSERLDGTSGYASISMPNTFSMSPNYVRRFVATNRLNRVPRDVFQLLDEKVDRLLREPAPSGSQGVVIAGDAKALIDTPALRPYLGKARLVVTSPPYLDIVNYARQNWIRSWLLAEHPDSALAEGLNDNLTLTTWLDFVEETVLQIKAMMRPDGVLVMVVGDVAKASRAGYISLAREFILRVRHDSGFRYVGCFEDYIGQDNKTTRIWKDTRGRATEVDRIIVLSDDVPNFRTSELRDALGLPGLSPATLKHISADALARNAEVFSSVTPPQARRRTKHDARKASARVSRNTNAARKRDGRGAKKRKKPLHRK